MKNFTYQKAIEYLNSLYNYESDAKRRSAPEFHLQRISQVMQKLGNPYMKYRVVHIAGTKGKGSVAVMLTSIAKAAGLKVGTYTSPHLFDLRERILVDGEFVDDDKFAHAIDSIRKVIGERPKEYATFFEVLTSAAFLLFAHENVELAVIEAGLGGQFDATNIVEPEIAILTKIALDHTDRLGETIGEIAGDKAHIIKPGCIAVIGDRKPEVLEPICARIKQVAAKVFFIDSNFACKVVEKDLTGTSVEINLAGEKFSVKLPLIGGFQGDNAAVASQAGAALGFDPKAVVAGLENVKLRGRMELISTDPTVIVDGAHNPASAQTTAREIVELGLAPAIFMLGINRPKDYSRMLYHWAKVAKMFIFTRLDSPRTYDPMMLARKTETSFGIRSLVIENPAKALTEAKRLAGVNGAVFVAGSLYMLSSLDL